MNDKVNRNQIIASNIKKYVSMHKITQKELANAIGISPSTLSDYMNLRSNPSYGVIQKIADYFGILKSDIDTTYKDPVNKDISSIYEKLNADGQRRVYDFANEVLQEQTSTSTTSSYILDDPALETEQKKFGDLNK